VPVFAVSRFMGTSIAMIDRHYGHLANDSRGHAVSLLDALALERAVDAAWTSHQGPRIEGVSSHSAGHAFASRMINRGISSNVLAQLIGHESSTITERRYIHLFDRQRTDEAVREAMAATSR
jgi:integrase